MDDVPSAAPDPGPGLHRPPWRSPGRIDNHFEVPAGPTEGRTGAVAVSSPETPIGQPEPCGGSGDRDGERESGLRIVSFDRIDLRRNSTQPEVGRHPEARTVYGVR
jgi:hypothetical protein